MPVLEGPPSSRLLRRQLSKEQVYVADIVPYLSCLYTVAMLVRIHARPSGLLCHLTK